MESSAWAKQARSLSLFSAAGQSVSKPCMTKSKGKDVLPPDSDCGNTENRWCPPETASIIWCLACVGTLYDCQYRKAFLIAGWRRTTDALAVLSRESKPRPSEPEHGESQRSSDSRKLSGRTAEGTGERTAAKNPGVRT